MTSFTAVVMAAGQGTRMRSATPKVLHEICGRPMVAWPVVAAQAAGASRVVVVSSPDVDLSAALPEGTRTATQPVPDGTGGAVLAALPETEPGAPVVVLSGDVPLVSAEAIQELVAAHVDSGAAATMATTIPADPSGYGRVVRDAVGHVEKVVETKADGDATADELEIREINTGIYCFDHGALADALPRVGTDNAQNEKYLPDVLALLRDDRRIVAAHIVDDPALVLGVNDRVQLADVTALAQRRILERHMRNGVTIVDPASTHIGAEVTIGQDTTIEPGTTINGATEIGANCVVRHSYVDQAILEDGVSVGPFAYLRPGTILRAKAKAGTFVEIKNSDIGEGTKVPHLSYIGDADVGPGTNLGAATITANYNGKTKAKSRTTIGANAKTSVDTTLVAPVILGDGAFTAAGSVVTNDVPPGALAVARARQRNVDGYADRD
ncbi:MAG TPA: bifunctional UDP-N-acetylglucosamine diphosphorylase/glucosamine-1-phosphate N-acetyltransferase GlmU [Baekduia sp.]|uniref:bifunctional UDP-N-acetylglucosamine diphosphorylase/glucosamine-1-phosphate N-acetyltransferase GlmU n=1 Tax=Baekduia sp. TaxID=2600305 RepID=UPI002D794F0D|nr:bifunctional UDP-N-acetylglucosamine diphosphorylase/glucosamine-1-phosphate N-acetyltransferase GlmU [Baekduia sp.]HET6505271.1 bifunctional UDP-N-acetylglucosamine diphosphorylase/glucosamine-1-phosphate N-acetyltransferase GlmU [Baekduia sp.]